MLGLQSSPLRSLLLLLSLSTVSCAEAPSDPLETSEEGALPTSDSSLGDPDLDRVPAWPGAGRGVLGGYEHGRIWGWAQLLEDDTPVHVRIDVDGVPVTTLRADEPRADLLRKGLHPTGEAGFSGVIDDLPEGAEVDAIIEETGALLTNAPCVVQGHGPVSSCTEGLSRGALDLLENGTLRGWAQIIGNPDPVTVRIEVDGEPHAYTLANLPRPDLVVKRLHPTGGAGFTIDLGPLPESAVIEAFIDETDDPLHRTRPALAPRSP